MPKKHEQVQTVPLASRFEVGCELRGAVNMRRANGERYTVLQRVEELGSSLSCGASVRSEKIPTRGCIAGGELLEDHVRHRTHVQRIHLGQVAPGSNATYYSGLRTA